MTDPIEFEEEVDLPPIIIDDPEYPNGSIITFERLLDGSGEIRINLKIDDANVGQELKIRTRITRETSTTLYTCPEPTRRVGSVPIDYPIVIDESNVFPGECHKVDVAVSGHFSRCREDPEDADLLFDDVDVADDIARATFWILETSNNDLFNDPAATQALIKSCQAIEYNPASGTP